jgi:hypothetical protein
MSFKREGDDHSWLNSLNKRRVSELFAESIPEDEAYLMKNGRFACLVCSHRPVFDTVSSLAIHRSGRKHLMNSEEFLYKKAEIDDLRLKRQHAEYVSSGKLPSAVGDVGVSRCGAMTTHHRLLGACLYDSRSKRRKYNTTAADRRLAVDLKTMSTDSCSVDSVSPETASCSPHSSEMLLPQTIADIRRHKEVVKSASERQVAAVKPYVSKYSSASNFVAGCQDECRFQTYSSSKSQEPYCEPQTNVSACSVVQRVVAASSTANISTVGCGDGNWQKSLENPEGGSNTAQLVQCDESPNASQPPDRVARFLRAIGSGWKRSRDGTWIKDEAAEFDSDEEPPDVV